MGFNRHKGRRKFDVKWGIGVITNESAECSIDGSGTATVESITEKASPANSLTRSREPLIDGSST